MVVARSHSDEAVNEVITQFGSYMIYYSNFDYFVTISIRNWVDADQGKTEFLLHGMPIETRIRKLLKVASQISASIPHEAMAFITTESKAQRKFRNDLSHSAIGLVPGKSVLQLTSTGKGFGQAFLTSIVVPVDRIKDHSFRLKRLTAIFIRFLSPELHNHMIDNGNWAEMQFDKWDNEFSSGFQEDFTGTKP